MHSSGLISRIAGASDIVNHGLGVSGADSKAVDCYIWCFSSDDCCRTELFVARAVTLGGSPGTCSDAFLDGHFVTYP